MEGERQFQEDLCEPELTQLSFPGMILFPCTQFLDVEVKELQETTD